MTYLITSWTGATGQAGHFKHALGTFVRLYEAALGLTQEAA